MTKQQWQDLINDNDLNKTPAGGLQPEKPAQVKKKAHQSLFHLTGRGLKKKFGRGSKSLQAFYRGPTGSLLTGFIVAWHGYCTALKGKALQRMVWLAQRISGCELLSIQDIYNRRCVKKAWSIIRDPTHPNDNLFSRCCLARSVAQPGS